MDPHFSPILRLRADNHRMPLLIDACALSLDFIWVITLRDRLWLSVAACMLTSLVRFAVVRRPGDAAIFALGGVAAAASDAVQVAAGVYTYPIAQLWVIPACMVPVWGQIVLFIASVLRMAHDPRPPSPAEFLIVSAAFAAALASVCLLYTTPLCVAAVSGAAAISILRLGPRRHDVPLVLVAATLGPASEAILVHNDVYRFTVAWWQQMPLWHPFFWAASLLFLRRGFAFARLA